MDASVRTVLFQVPNEIGLGHMSRMAAVSAGLRDRDPSLRTAFLVEGASHFFLESLGLPCLSIPHRDRLERSWSAWSASERADLFGNLAATVIRGLRPHAIVFDTFPRPEVLRAAFQSGAKLAVCVRLTKEKYQSYLRWLQSSPVDLILIPHEPEEIPFPTDDLTKARIVGTIRRPPTARGDGPPAMTPRVVITGGGGGYPGTVNFFNLAAAAFAEAHQHDPDLSGVLVTGPLFSDWWRLEPVAGLRLVPFDPALAALMAEADLVICQGGYNTMAEIEPLRTRVICIPGERGADDQFARAAALASRRGGFRVYTGSDAGPLSELIVSALREPRPDAPPPVVGRGAEKAAEAILGLIAGDRGRSTPDGAHV